jgi:hypothetical protein
MRDLQCPSVPSGIIVHEDTGGAIAPKRFLHDLTGTHAHTVDRAAEEVLVVDRPVPATEVDDGETGVLRWVPGKPVPFPCWLFSGSPFQRASISCLVARRGDTRSHHDVYLGDVPKRTPGIHNSSAFARDRLLCPCRSSLTGRSGAVRIALGARLRI